MNDESATKWRDRADECYLLASLKCSDESRSAMLKLADKCTNLSKFFERKSARPAKLPAPHVPAG